VYAIHGHWLDAHAGGRRFENRVIAKFERWLPLPDRATPRDYERVSAPLYRVANLFLTGAGRKQRLGLFGRLTRRIRARKARQADTGKVSAPPTGSGSSPPVAGGASATGVPGAPPPKKGEGRPRTVQAMTDVVAHLQIDARHVLFGHTHRAGPLPADDPDAWQTPAGPRLVNLGSWVYDQAFAGVEPGRSPYWPGRLVLLEDADPPELVGLLDDLPAERWEAPGDEP
jgi:hypothetical protein